MEINHAKTKYAPKYFSTVIEVIFFYCTWLFFLIQNLPLFCKRKADSRCITFISERLNVFFSFRQLRLSNSNIRLKKLNAITNHVWAHLKLCFKSTHVGLYFPSGAENWHLSSFAWWTVFLGCWLQKEKEFVSDDVHSVRNFAFEIDKYGFVQRST